MMVAVLFVLCALSWFPAGAYEDGECLICHKKYGSYPAHVPERVSRLIIDEEDWERDVHFAVGGLACDDCHTDATPETHPEEGLRKVNCAECHDEVAVRYYRTAHFTAPSEGGDSRPDCADCHTPHTIRAKDDPHSSTFKGNVYKLCLRCHEEKDPSATWLTGLLLFQVSAHRKSDISQRFDPAGCVNCHYTQAIGHGDSPLTEYYCGTCHAADTQAGGLIFGPFHRDPSLKDQPLVLAAALLNAVILLALSAFLLLLMVRGFVSKGGGGRSAQQPGG